MAVLLELEQHLDHGPLPLERVLLVLVQIKLLVVLFRRGARPAAAAAQPGQTPRRPLRFARLSSTEPVVNGRVIRFDDSSYDSSLLKTLMTL